MQPDDKTAKEFSKWGKEPPRSYSHGTIEDIRGNLKRLQPNSWRLEGNKLIGQTEMGELVQFIPTNYILEGTDDQGLPKLVKLELKN